jgi:pimeloyl-ACP methyl ester carboxylesterase
MCRPGKAVKVLLIAFCVIIAFLLTILLYFVIKSPGKVEPFLDSNGNVLENSISEKVFVDINGIKQGMFISGENRSNPVLLFLHGGPGMPEYFMFDKYGTGLEKYFTVCFWEQRGGGISYSAGMSGEEILVTQLVSDTAEVANYLRERFGQDKIYLMGHSWGTFIGIQAAAANPGLYHAYIGMSQIKNQEESEILAYDYMFERYFENGDTKRIKQLERFNVHDGDANVYDFFTSSLRDTCMHELGIGTMSNMHSVVSGIFFPMMNCRAYTFGEKINIWAAKSFLRKETNLLWEMLNTDLSAIVIDLEIPVYFVAGTYDYTVNYNMQKEYFTIINSKK